MSVATVQAVRETRYPTLVLVLALVQGSSLSLSLALHFRGLSGVFEPAVNGLWALLYCLALLGLTARFGINWLAWMLRFRLPLVLLLASVLMSTQWSIDPALTAERSIHLIGTSLTGIYLGLSIPIARLLRVTAAFLLLLLIASAAAALLYPALGLEDYQGQQVWRGVTASKNTLGFWAAISALLSACLWVVSQRQGARVMASASIALALVVLAFSGSATSMLAMLAGSLLMTYLALARQWRLGFLATCALGVFMCALALLAFLHIDTAEMIGRSRDLTGRGEVWSQTWELILQAPLTGYGYGTLWFPTDASLWIQESLTQFNWTVYHAHNGLLQIASEIGLPLTLLAIIMLIQQMVEVIYGQYRQGNALTLFVPGFLLALLVSNYAEARLLVNRELYWILFLALPVALLNTPVVAQTRTLRTRRLAPLLPALPADTRSRALTVVAERHYRRQLKNRLRHQREPERAPVAALLSSPS